MKFMCCTLVTLLLYACHPVLAHEEAGSDPAEKAMEYGTLIERLSNLEMSAENQNPRPAVPFVKILGKKYYLNSHFYQLTEEIARLYIEEVRGVCAQCDLPSKEKINEEVKELVARGWLKHVAGAATRTVAVRYGSEFIHLGARYGTMAGALKVAGELVEDAMLVVFKMPGAHFLCEVITLAISYYSGSILTMWRTWNMSRHFGRSKIMTMSRLAATSWVVKRALKKIQLELGPIEIHPELLDPESRKSESREWLAENWSEKKDKITRFLLKVETRVNQYYQEIAELEKQMESADERTARRHQRKINSLRKKISSITKVKIKVFEARRRGLTLWIFKRNKAMSLNPGEPGINSHFRGTKIWMVPMTASVTNPGLQLNESMERSVNSFRNLVESGRAELADTGINRVLLQEAQEKGLNPEQAQKLLADVESLFDTKESRRNRYLRLMMMEGFYGQVLPRVLRQFVVNVTNQVINEGSNTQNIKRVIRMQWSAGKLIYFTDMYLDYLRSASILKGRSKLVFEKDLAKDYMMEVFRTLNLISSLKSVSELETLDRINQELVERIKTHEAQRFWIEKRAEHKFIPIRQTFMSLIGLGRFNNYFRKRPACAKIYY